MGGTYNRRRRRIPIPTPNNRQALRRRTNWRTVRWIAREAASVGSYVVSRLFGSLTKTVDEFDSLFFLETIDGENKKIKKKGVPAWRELSLAWLLSFSLLFFYSFNHSLLDSKKD